MSLRILICYLLYLHVVARTAVKKIPLKIVPCFIWKTLQQPEQHFMEDLIQSALDFFEYAVETTTLEHSLNFPSNTMCFNRINLPQNAFTGKTGHIAYVFTDDPNLINGASRTLASTQACTLESQGDQYMSITSAYTVFNSRFVTLPPNDDRLFWYNEAYLNNILHEITHALIWNQLIWPYMLKIQNKVTNTPLKIPGSTEVYDCYALPGIKKWLNDYFGMNTLNCIPVEDPKSSINDHPKKRFFLNEAMATSLMPGMKYSDLNSVMLNLVPPYNVKNPSAFDTNMIWGRNKGTKIWEANEATFNGGGFRETCQKNIGWGCGANYEGAGYCSSVGSPAPDTKVYFFLPETACDNADVPKLKRGIFGDYALQSFGPNENSKCFLATFDKVSNDSNGKPFCFKQACSADNSYLNVTIGTTVVKCTKSGERAQIPGYEGYFACPDPAVFCKYVSRPRCPKNCYNHGKCKNGKCQCSNGWQGKDCSLKKTWAYINQFGYVNKQKYPLFS